LEVGIRRRLTVTSSVMEIWVLMGIVINENLLIKREVSLIRDLA